MQMETLFTLPLSSEASVTCTRPVDKVYVLTFINPPDNRLRSDLCQALILALDILELRYPPGAVITTSGIPKFYSNGLDLNHATSTPGFWDRALYPLWRRLITYPMPTVALINGHAYAGALMLAMMHDYRFMNPHRGFLCLPELHMGVPMQSAMVAPFREKLSAATFRSLVLEARRYKALDALKDGIVDGLGGMDEVLAFVKEMELRKMSETGVYGALKTEMWRETIALLEARIAGLDVSGEEKDRQAREEMKRKVEQWEKSVDRAKL